MSYMIEINYNQCLIAQNFYNFINDISQLDPDKNIRESAKEIAYSFTGNNTLLTNNPKYNKLYLKYKFKVSTESTNDGYKLTLYRYSEKKQQLVGLIEGSVNSINNFNEICCIRPSPTNSIISTPSLTPSISATLTVTPSITLSNSEKPTVTPTKTITPTITPSFTATPSIQATHTPTKTVSKTACPSRSVTVTPTVTPTVSITPSVTKTPSKTPTVTKTPSKTPSVTPSFTPTKSILPTPTPSKSIGPAITPTKTVTKSSTPLPTPLPPQSPPGTPKVTPSFTKTPGVSPSESSSPPVPTPSASQSDVVIEPPPPPPPAESPGLSPTPSVSALPEISVCGCPTLYRYSIRSVYLTALKKSWIIDPSLYYVYDDAGNIIQNKVTYCSAGCGCPEFTGLVYPVPRGLYEIYGLDSGYKLPIYKTVYSQELQRQIPVDFVRDVNDNIRLVNVQRRIQGLGVGNIDRGIDDLTSKNGICTSPLGMDYTFCDAPGEPPYCSWLSPLVFSPCPGCEGWTSPTIDFLSVGWNNSSIGTNCNPDLGAYPYPEIDYHPTRWPNGSGPKSNVNGACAISGMYKWNRNGRCGYAYWIKFCVPPSGGHLIEWTTDENKDTPYPHDDFTYFTITESSKTLTTQYYSGARGGAPTPPDRNPFSGDNAIPTQLRLYYAGG